jgi:hypothetical protein
MSTYQRPWRIVTSRFPETRVTLYTVLKRDESHIGNHRDGYFAVGSRKSLDDAFRFIANAMGEVSA